ncbi:MAG: hypothetical protein ABSA47_14190 [Verrucomicrobiota bacterium]
MPGIAVGVLAAPAYLPVVGPVPLRFRAPAPPVTNLVRMTLPPPDAAPVSPPPVAEVAAKTNAPPVAPSPAAPVPEANPTAISNTPGPVAASAVPEPMVSPQMLLRYFNRTTNGISSAITTPMEFAPPIPAGRPSSTATYSTNPN